MYIDTHTKESMEKSICDIFCISPVELQSKLEMIDRDSVDEDNYIEKLNMFIDDNVTEYPDEILLFHLARRLNGTENFTDGRNLANMLITDNKLSSFLKEYGIEFMMGKQHIDVLYKGEIVDWDKCLHGNSDYMKLRLGYFKDRKDFCFNGFAMKDLLYRNSYARELFCVPEFLRCLTDCLQCKEVEQKYMANSDYFCYEYKLPLSIVLFDKHDDYSNRLKQRYFLQCVLQRLRQYQTSELRYMSDDDNPILRLADDYIVPSTYYLTREKISMEMLSY